MRNFPPIQRCAAGGERGPPGTGDIRHDMACALPPPGGGGKRGRDTKVSLPLLTPQPFLWTRLPSVARLNTRAHRGVWCSKGTPLMEAELFAAESGRPAPDGRALLCAADHARETQGITASHKRNDARNRAPVTPFRCTSSMCQRQKEGLGCQEGTGNHTWCPVPFCLRRQTAAIPLAGENRRLRRQTAAIFPRAL